MHRNLRSLLELLRRERDIITVETEVDPSLELAEVHRRVIERGGPALLFTKVKGGRYPVVMSHGIYGKDVHFSLAFKPQWEKLLELYPDLCRNGSSGRFLLGNPRSRTVAAGRLRHCRGGHAW